MARNIGFGIDGWPADLFSELITHPASTFFGELSSIFAPSNQILQTGAILPPVLTGTIQDGNDQFAVSIRSYDGTAIDPSRTTWVIIHGWNSSPDEFSSLVSAIHSQRPSDQILVLDWSTAANTGVFNPFDAEDRVPLVAAWAATALTDAGFSGSNLNEIGHSFGSYVAGEIAELIPGGVNTIVGLDPALNLSGGYDSEGAGGVHFAQHSQYSWTFHDSDPANLGNLDGLGSPITPTTADEAFNVANSNHSQIRDLFTYFLNHPDDPVGQNFTLQRLLDHETGPWQLDQYNANGAPSIGGGYEAVITATGGGAVPQSIVYVALEVNHAVANDFNGDGRSDLMWQHTSGTFSEWQSNGNSFTPNVFVGGVGPGWHSEGAFDFSGDGQADLLWRSDTTGQFTIWNSTGNGFAPNSFVGGVSNDWTVAALADFNGDGYDDMIFRNSTSGTFSVWQSTGTGFTPNVFVSTVDNGWHLTAAADFSGDGKADLLWRNDNGSLAEWQSNGNGFTPNVYAGVVDPAWHVLGTGDFSGDGRTDILFRHDSGTFTEWQSTGNGFTANVYVNSGVGNAWQLAQTGDFNSDGRDDLLWRDSNGTFTEWQSTGNSFTPNIVVGNVASDWNVITHQYDLV